jgi:hypothetical protein
MARNEGKHDRDGPNELTQPLHGLLKIESKAARSSSERFGSLLANSRRATVLKVHGFEVC